VCVQGMVVCQKKEPSMPRTMALLAISPEWDPMLLRFQPQYKVQEATYVWKRCRDLMVAEVVDPDELYSAQKSSGLAVRGPGDYVAMPRLDYIELESLAKEVKYMYNRGGKTYVWTSTQDAPPLEDDQPSRGVVLKRRKAEKRPSVQFTASDCESTSPRPKPRPTMAENIRAKGRRLH